MPFDLLNILLIFSLGYGILQIPLLVMGKAEKSMSNPVLLLITTLLWIQFEFLAVRNVWSIPQGIFFGTQFGSWLFLGPSLYFYIQSTLSVGIDKRKLILQLIPAFILVFILPFFIQDAIPERAVNYGMLTVLAYSKMGYTFWQGFYGTVFIAQFIHLAIYIFLSLKLLFETEQNLKSMISQSFPLIWLKATLIIMSSIIVGSGFFFYQLLTSYRYYRYWDFFYTLPFAIATYFIVFKLNRYPQLFRADLRLIGTSSKYEKSGLDKELLESYAERLKTSVGESKLYLRHDLTLKSLADELKMNPHHLSQVFNQAMNTTFFDFINNYRVREAQRLLEANNVTVLEVAMNAGFSTKASFNKYFKLVTGMTPTEFMKKEQPVME